MAFVHARMTFVQHPKCAARRRGEGIQQGRKAVAHTQDRMKNKGSPCHGRRPMSDFQYTPDNQPTGRAQPEEHIAKDKSVAYFMLLHGNIIDNLEAALQSARRHRGKPLYADTVTYWNALLGHSREFLDLTPNPDAARRVMACLEVEIADRTVGACDT